jgi:hypothetical protein
LRELPSGWKEEFEGISQTGQPVAPDLPAADLLVPKSAFPADGTPGRIANYQLKTTTWTDLFLKATFPTLLCHKGSADTPHPSINHNCQNPGARRRKDCYR